MADYINKDNKHSDISIIVPVYKGRQYIPEIIENIQKNAQYIKNKKLRLYLSMIFRKIRLQLIIIRLR